MTRRLFLFVASVSLVACSGSAMVSSDASTVLPGDDASTLGDHPGTAVNNGVGRLCDIGTDAGAAQSVYNANAGECPSGICLKPSVQNNAYMPSLFTAATCTAECAQDSDCQGELRDSANNNDRRCHSGFSCVAPFAVGPLCCKKLCVCKDFLAASGAQTPSACLGAAAATCAAATSDPNSSAPSVSEETDITIGVSPNRKLDLVFMIDNSPGMYPKQAKLNAQFPKLIEALKNPDDGTLPDLRLAILDSDLGTGGAYPTGSCGPKNGRNYGDLARFQMIGAAACSVTSSDALFLEYKSGAPLNYKGDISSVFSCLATNLGTIGCGEEHQLQAFEFALAAKGIGNEDQQNQFLRADAQLALVFLSDEDDCSAATNDGMFGSRPGDTDLSSESASLRCYTRSHMCNGKNLSESGPGYPTTQAFTTTLSACSARTDACSNATDGDAPTDTSLPTRCSPLKSIKHLADHIKAVKSSADQITVAGIFGWPRPDVDATTAQYKIDMVPNPTTMDTAHPTLFDSWPVCYDPDHLPPGTGFDVSAATWGATAGLRLSAFVDEFGVNGMKFSACERTFADTMTKIGTALAKKMQDQCVNYKLFDSDPATPGLQPSCRVTYKVPMADPNDATRILYTEGAPLPQCPAGATNGKVSADCWRLENDIAWCPSNGQRLRVLRTADEIKAGPLVPGTKVAMQCQTCPALTSGSPTAGCDY